MPIKSPTGKTILTAGEVGAFCVCPEAWRLRSLEHARSLKTPEVKEGRRLHDEWAATIHEAVYLTQRVRLVIALLTAACLAYYLTR